MIPVKCGICGVLVDGADDVRHDLALHQVYTAAREQGGAGQARGTIAGEMKLREAARRKQARRR